MLLSLIMNDLKGHKEAVLRLKIGILFTVHRTSDGLLVEKAIEDSGQQK